MKKTILAIVSTSLLLVGCSNNPSAVDITKGELQSEQIKNDVAQSRAENALASMPSWVLEPPKPDSTGVYGVGIGESQQLDLAMKKANLNAQFELAKTFGQELSGSEQNYTQDGLNTNSSQYTQLIDSIVDSVYVHGYETIKQDAIVQDGKYTVYKLTKLTYEQFNRSIDSEVNNFKSEEIKQAFSELQQRLEQRKQ